MMVPFPSECRESKVRYPARAEKEAKPPLSRACPGGIDTFHPVGKMLVPLGKL